MGRTSEVFIQLSEIAQADRLSGKNLRPYIGSLHLQTGEDKYIIFPTDVSKKGKPSFSLCQFIQKEEETSRKFSKIRIKRGGIIQIKNQKIQTIEEFRSIIAPLPAPEGLELFYHRNQFAHVWGLMGIMKVDETFYCDKEGTSCKKALQTLLREVEELELSPELMMENIFFREDMKATMTEALINYGKLIQLRRMKKYAEAKKFIIELIRSSRPFFLPSGFIEHATVIAYYKGMMAYTNKGFNHKKNLSGTYYFEVDETVFIKKLKDLEFFRKLLGKCSEGEFLSFQPYKSKFKQKYRGEMTVELNLRFLGFDPKEPQRVGNCTLANSVPSLHALVNMKSLDEHPLAKNETICDRANKHRFDYKVFTFHFRTSVTERIIKIIGRHHNEFNEDLDQAITKMKRKYLRYCVAGKFRDHKQEMAKVCQFYTKKMEELILSDDGDCA